MGSRFNMLIGDELTTQMKMSDAIRQSCTNKGVHSIYNKNAFDIEEVRTENSPKKRSEMVSKLSSVSEDIGYKLTNVQLSAIANTVWPYSSKIKIEKHTRDVCQQTPREVSVNNRLLANFTQEITNTYISPVSDIQRVSILDMVTGSGKTITSLVSSLMFTMNRQDDMGTYVHPTESSIGCIQVMPRSNKGSNNTCIVFTPRHLMDHWGKHAIIAKKMACKFDNSWNIVIYKNKKVSEIEIGEKEIALIICDIKLYGIKKILEPGQYYSSICFDECGETSVEANAAWQIMKPDVSVGRIILCSADLTKWRHTRLRDGSVLKNLFPRFPSGQSCMYAFGNSNYLHRDEAAHASTVDSMYSIASLAMASVFDESERTQMMTDSVASLDGCTVYSASVQYVPTLMERLGNGIAADIGEVHGCQMFKTKYGLDISECKTFGDIQSKLQVKVDSITNNIDELIRTGFPHLCHGLRHQQGILEKVCEQMEKILSEDCPICLEELTDARVIQPCMHFTCSTCIGKLGRRCPICRGDIDGCVQLETKRAITEVEEVEECESKNLKSISGDPVETDDTLTGDLGKNFLNEIEKECTIYPIPGGVAQCLVKTLRCIKNTHERMGGSTLKIILITPGANVRGGDFEDTGFTMIPHRTNGTTDDPASLVKLRKNMERFNSDDGDKKILLVRDQADQSSYGNNSIDTMTGLDVDALDVVISVGSKNTAQRMGRLCRLSRGRMSENKKSALYIQLVKGEEF